MLLRLTVCSDGLFLGVDDGKPFSRWRHDPLRAGEHLQIGGFHHRLQSFSIPAFQLISVQPLRCWLGLILRRYNERQPEVSDVVRASMKSAMNRAIRHGILVHEGDLIWRQA
jgi:hypothetical protein